ncbi:MAG: hypothetical protein K1X91_09005 [Bacteriodetes bacterium]|nr:hypothetical protein [Bacteroidota bacterium]
MKLFFAMLIVLAGTHTTHAQDWSKLPELPVWYEQVNGNLGLNMQYLPYFDTANGGADAVYHNAPGIGGITVYNRYKGDTANMFSWQNSIPELWYGDFNGDGITDYFNSNYGVYLGVKKNAPPRVPSVQSYYPGHSAYRGKVTDINQDGKDDLIFSAYVSPSDTKLLGSIILGNTEITNMEVVSLPLTEYLDFNENAQCLMDAYYLQGKGMRIITMTWDNKRANGKLHLWAVDIQGDVGKRVLKYQNISNVNLFNEDAQLIAAKFHPIHSNIHDIHCVKIHPITYNLINDVFSTSPITLEQGSGFSYQIAKPIHKESECGWLVGSTVNTTCNIICFDGSPIIPQTGFARFPCYLERSGETELIRLTKVVSTGDVNNDGLNDIASTYTSGKYRIFRIYLGIDQNTNVGDSSYTNDIGISIQNPIQKNLPYTIEITSPKESPAKLELYSLQGIKIIDIWNGGLTIGANSIPLNAQRNSLPSGMYNLRLIVNKQIIDKAIIIE